MKKIDLEEVRLAMFAHPGVKSVDSDLRVYRTSDGGAAVAGTIILAAPDVDQATILATVEKVLRERLGIDEAALLFKGAGPAPPDSQRGPLEKK